MALIRCSECGQTVSDKAATCPRCGNPIAAPNGSNNNWLYWLIGGLALIGLILFFTLALPMCSSSSGSDHNTISTTSSSTVDTAAQVVETAAAPAVKEEAKEAAKVEEAPSGPTMYFIVISSHSTLSSAKDKARDVGGMVVKGYSKKEDRTMYRVCVGSYNSKSEAKDHLGWAKSNYVDNAWILTEKEGSIVYR